MSETEFELRNLVQTRFAGLDTLVDVLNASLLEGAITRYNSEFGPRYFGRPPTEPIPIEPRRLTEFRTRIGPLIEYGLAVTIDVMLKGLFVPAIDVAQERDRHLAERGGRFEAGRPLVPPHWNTDTNFGKIDRIVHPRRRDATDLSRHAQALLDFAQRQAEAVRRAAEGTTREPTPTEDEAARG